MKHESNNILMVRINPENSTSVGQLSMIYMLNIGWWLYDSSTDKQYPDRTSVWLSLIGVLRLWNTSILNVIYGSSCNMVDKPIVWVTA